MAATDPLPEEVIHALRHGNTVEAIKRLRESTGLGLKESKAVIDRYLAGKSAMTAASAPASRPAHAAHHKPVPGLSPGEIPGSGKITGFIVAMALAAAAIIWWTVA
jgi:hypothetical protein